MGSVGEVCLELFVEERPSESKVSLSYFYIKSLKWRYKKNYKNLIPIEYSSYIDGNYTLACVIKNTIEDNAFISVTVIGSEVPFQQNDAPL